jgi:uncharacterized protein (TIGR02996 family)
VTTEDDFQKQLDAEPHDHHTRLIFADWLDERDDPRGPGYRALGTLQRVPVLIQLGRQSKGSPSGRQPRHIYGQAPKAPTMNPEYKICEMPADWFLLIPQPPECDNNSPTWRYFATRRAAEDAAALAFAQLPAKRRAKLLDGQSGTGTQKKRRRSGRRGK